MANTFKVVTFAAEPNSAGTPYTVYTTPSSTTTVVIGLVLANINTTAVTAEVELVSDTSGGKVILETTDAIRIDCSVADKLSGTLSIMEIT